MFFAIDDEGGVLPGVVCGVLGEGLVGVVLGVLLFLFLAGDLAFTSSEISFLLSYRFDMGNK